jgi:predicted unusual protein kinase regulating ubiquinone biosynthesis (AarF/ABC1/UbiB family)
MKRVLGDAKGGALKAGQLLSTVEALFPADPEATWRQALATLPADNPPVPFAELQPVLIADLGRDWRNHLEWFDTAASAAASIGQVHRAVWHDGRQVAVKIQYPGVAEALRTDLAAVSVMTRLSALIAPGMALPPLVAEMRERVGEELDYRREGRVQQAFATAYADHQDVVVPQVVHATPMVLVTEWLDGTPFTHLDQARQSQRNTAGLRYMRFLLSGPATTGWLHTDPHPGNFRITPDGRLGVLDFGSALRMPDGMPATFGRLITLLALDDPAQIRRGLQAEGFIRPGSQVDAIKLRDYLSPFIEPSRHEVFSFTPEWLKSQFGRLGDPRNPDFAVALQLTMPPEHLFTHRVWLGIVGVLCQLRATIPVRQEVGRWLPGLE